MPALARRREGIDPLKKIPPPGAQVLMNEFEDDAQEFKGKIICARRSRLQVVSAEIWVKLTRHLEPKHMRSRWEKKAHASNCYKYIGPARFPRHLHS